VKRHSGSGYYDLYVADNATTALKGWTFTFDDLISNWAVYNGATYPGGNGMFGRAGAANQTGPLTNAITATVNGPPSGEITDGWEIHFFAGNAGGVIADFDEHSELSVLTPVVKIRLKRSAKFVGRVSGALYDWSGCSGSDDGDDEVEMVFGTDPAVEICDMYDPLTGDTTYTKFIWLHASNIAERNAYIDVNVEKGRAVTVTTDAVNGTDFIKKDDPVEITDATYTFFFPTAKTYTFNVAFRDVFLSSVSMGSGGNNNSLPLPTIRSVHEKTAPKDTLVQREAFDFAVSIRDKSPTPDWTTKTNVVYDVMVASEELNGVTFNFSSRVYYKVFRWD